MNVIRTLIFCIATAAAAVAMPPKAVNLDHIKDKVSISLGHELQVKFTAQGDRLMQPMILKRPDENGAVTIKLKATDSTPFRVRGVATRPFLTVSHGFERTLHCRALARLKGSREFFEVGGVESIPPGENSLKCWESGSLVEEVILYQFSLSPIKSK